MEKPRFYVHDDHLGKWCWKYFAPDPRTFRARIVARCEIPFETRADCERAIDEMRELGLTGQIHYAQSTS